MREICASLCSGRLDYLNFLIGKGAMRKDFWSGQVLVCIFAWVIIVQKRCPQVCKVISSTVL